MLVLMQKVGDSVIIGDNIEVKILEISKGRAKVGFKAPREIPILREKLLKLSRQKDK